MSDDSNMNKQDKQRLPGHPSSGPVQPNPNVVNSVPGIINPPPIFRSPGMWQPLNYNQVIIQRLDGLSNQVNQLYMLNMQQQQHIQMLSTQLNSVSINSSKGVDKIYTDLDKVRKDYADLYHKYIKLLERNDIVETILNNKIKELSMLKEKNRYDLNETIDDNHYNDVDAEAEEDEVDDDNDEDDEDNDEDDDSNQQVDEDSDDDVKNSDPNLKVTGKNIKKNRIDMPIMFVVKDVINDKHDKGTDPIESSIINKMQQLVSNMKKHTLSDGYTRNKPTIVTEDDDYESEYDSDEEYNEIDDLNTLDDLIRVGKMYDTLIDKTTHKNSDDFVKKALLGIGMNKEDAENMLKNSSSVKVLKKVHETKTINKGKGKKRRGCYTYNGVNYSIDLEKLNKLVGPLEELNAMIGMEYVKKEIVSQVLYLLQKFEKIKTDMLHTVLEGPPGVGKSELGRILGKIYQVLGASNGKFETVRREHLIGEYLGHTEGNIKRLLKEVEGGVLFIDEAYALGNEGRNDSYSEAAINTIVGALDDPTRHFVCIVAGYPDELKTKFFGSNPGMERRFPFRYSIMSYEPDQLRDIFLKKVHDSKFKISDEIEKEKLTSFFVDNKDKFPNFGGDMKKLFLQCKISHSARICGKHPRHRKKLTMGDITTAFDIYLKDANIKSETKNIVESKKQQDAIERMMREYKHKKEYRKMIEEDIKEETLNDMVINAECKLKLQKKKKDLLQEYMVEDMLLSKKARQEVKKMLYDILRQEALDDMEFDMSCKDEFRKKTKDTIKESTVEQLLFENECKKKFEKDLNKKELEENDKDPSLRNLYI